MKQFTLKELAQVLPDGDKKEQLPNLDKLRFHLLNPICDSIKGEISVVPSSGGDQYVKGEAINLSSGNISDNKKLFSSIKGMFLEFDRLGYHEIKDSTGKLKNYVSIAYRHDRNRNQVIVDKR